MTSLETMQVKVPMKLKQLMEATNYDKTKDEFLTDCIWSGCSCAMSELDFDLM